MEEVKVMEYLVKFESSLISVNENIISLRKDMDNIRTELKGDISDLRTELKGDIDNVRIELTEKIENSQQFLRDVINETADALYEEQKKYNDANDNRIEKIEKIVFANNFSMVNEDSEDYNM